MKITVACSLEQEVVIKVKKLADKENSSVSRIINLALERYLKREEKK